MATSEVTPSGGVRSILRALGHRNFRLFFLGQGVSLIGTWMQQVALSWLVYRLSGSPVLLGLVAFCGQIPALVLAPVAGVLIDRSNRRRLLFATQALAMLQAFLLAYLTLTGEIAVWHTVVLGVILGIVTIFDVAARQVFITEMLDAPTDLPNAIALNSSLVNGARLIGPALAGVVIGLVGEGTCFLLNGLSYLAVLAALAAMHLPARPRPHTRRPVLHELREGLVYAFGFPPIRAILLLVALVSLGSASLTTLMPVFVTNVLEGGPELLGTLMAASGLGALTAALYLASRSTIRGLGPRMTLAGGALGAALIALAAVEQSWAALPLCFAAGFSLMALTTASNTILQTIVEEDKRGRVMSLYAMALLGAMPLGSLLAGGLADAIGMETTLALAGLCCVAAALWFGLQLPQFRRFIRPVYEEKGILPLRRRQPAAAGVKVASP
jgi:MFS family permease